MNIDKVINKLNELSKLDPKATYELFTKQVNVNEALTKDDCTFMCGKKGDSFVMGTLGLINGLIDGGVIAMDVDFKEEKILKFVKYNKGE
ncbi:hypothetical protein [Providencia sp. 2024EL-00606]|uniref:hypothetical protein n=1 Tax=Providencia sp. 2024EL-00606 TaxID=3350765 RepID=UPI0024AA4BDB|nr:hypothetical protein [Providencia rettgeri]MDX4118419.1 hypothetical protein [Providencia rettgeri]